MFRQNKDCGSQEINIPTIKDFCQKKTAEELAAARKHKSSGGKVLGYTCHAFPASIAAGLGLWPVRVVCGTTKKSESDGEAVIRPDICPFVKSLIGNISSGTGVHKDVDVWIGLLTCDQMRRGMEVISRDLNKFVYPIQLPSTRTKEAAGYYEIQVRRFISDMERTRLLSFDIDKALKWQAAYDEAGAVLMNIAVAGQVAPSDLHAMFHLLFISRPFGLSDFLKGLIEGNDKFETRKKIIVTGSPITLEDKVLFDLLVEKGFSVVPLNCTGINACEKPEIEATGDAITSLISRAFYKPPCARARPNKDVYERIIKASAMVNAAGIIVKCLNFCDLWYTERERMRKAFDVPVLVYDSDYSEGGRERLASRVEAFLEII